MAAGPVGDEAVAALMAALRAAVPYVVTSARHHERLGLAEEAAAAWTVYRRARWALDAVTPGAGASGTVEYED